MARRRTPALKARQHKWILKQGPNYRSIKHRLERYRIDPDGFAQTLYTQNHACKICETPFTSSRNAYVDHDHETGHIRGLLCPKCNTTIGFLESLVKDGLFGRGYAYLQTNGRGVDNFDFDPFARITLTDANEQKRAQPDAAS